MRKDKKLVSIVVGNDHLSLVYQKLKQKACEEAGVNYELRITYNVSEAISAIQQCNHDDNVTGIMVQLPAPNKEELINAIDPKKDVDGMRDDSPFVAPVVQAVMHVLNDNVRLPLRVEPYKVCVMGNEGFVGKKIVKELEKDKKYVFSSLDSAEVVISATGSAGLIKPDMIKDGAVLIDVGAPKPDFDPECYKKALFYTPVPGGIGPLTIQYLVQNLLEV